MIKSFKALTIHTAFAPDLHLEGCETGHSHSVDKQNNGPQESCSRQPITQVGDVWFFRQAVYSVRKESLN
jgi:hypothetical protein